MTCGELASTGGGTTTGGNFCLSLYKMEGGRRRSDGRYHLS